jgi:hypothetical protein
MEARNRLAAVKRLVTSNKRTLIMTPRDEVHGPAPAWREDNGRILTRGVVAVNEEAFLIVAA